jgi:hypothetical protein
MVNVGTDSSRREQTNLESTTDVWWYKSDGQTTRMEEDGRLCLASEKQVRFDGGTGGDEAQALRGGLSVIFQRNQVPLGGLD